MSEEQVKELLNEIEIDEDGYGYIDCNTATEFTDNNQYERIVAALKQNIELQQLNSAIKAEKAELESRLESLEKRLSHLFISNCIAAYDAINPVSKDYLLDINEVDSFFKTGNKLIFEYADKNKTDRVDDFKIEKKKAKHMINKKIVYDPIPKEPIELKIKIIENSDKIVCPICGNPLGKYPAISRQDNETKICSNCGTLEALAAFKESLKDDKENEKDI